jgi:predicted secreted acid phosphatase
MLAVFTEETYQKMNTEEKLEQVYGALRYIKFLNAKYQDER